MATRRERQWGARAAVAAGATLLAASLAGTPLYTSSSATAAVQQQLLASCPAITGLGLYVRQVGWAEQLDAAAATVAHVDSAVHVRTAMGSYPVNTPQGVANLQLRVIWATGEESSVTPSLPTLAIGDLAMPVDRMDNARLVVGDHMSLTPASSVVVVNGTPATTRAPVDLRVATTFDPIPIYPEPKFWCGLGVYLEPNSQGDFPMPMAIASETTVQVVDPSAPISWNLAVDPRGLTRHAAGQVEQAFQGLVSTLTTLESEQSSTAPQTGVRVPNRTRPSDGLPTVLHRADAIAAAVSRTIAPVRLAGVLAASLLLVAAAAMTARERRRELRLAALRGVGPAGTMRWLAPTAVGACAIGTVLGTAAAFGAVRWLGPAPEFETAVVVRAALTAVVGFVAACALVIAVAAWVGGRSVDVRDRRHWWRFAPVELVFVALAVVAYRRLRDVGGVRMFGAYSRGGELLAQGFPLLALVALIAVLVRPMRWLAVLARTSGHRLPRALRLGWRRSIGEPAATAALAAAVALAVGCAMLGVVLSRSAQGELIDKAHVYVGADLAVRVDQPGSVPPSLVDRGTVTTRHAAHSGKEQIDVLGVDPATFARAANWRDDASSRSLTQLLALLGPARADGSLPALVVMSNADTRLEDADVVTVDGFAETAAQRMTVHPVATVRWFPGFHSGSTLLVVDRAALTKLDLASTDTVLVRDPPADVIAQITAQDGAARNVQPAATVFDAVTFSAERWAYDAVGWFAVLIAAMAIVLQLLVVEARRDVRQASDVVLRRTGFGLRATWVAAIVEVGVPVVAGLTIGITGGWLVARVAVPHLDPLRELRPPPITVVPVGGLVAAVGVAAVAAVALAWASVVSTRRADVMEVVRGTA